MIQKLNSVKGKIIIFLIIQVIVIAILKLVFDKGILAASIIVIMEAIIIWYVFYYYNNQIEKNNEQIGQQVNTNITDACVYGETGFIIYDDTNYCISYMSELFSARQLNRLGERLLKWLPEVDELISGKAESVEVKLDDRTYAIRRKENTTILMFKDITDVITYKQHYNDEQVVIGLINLDNYDESTQYADEAEVSQINTSVRTPIIEYGKEHNILLKRVSNSRYLAVLNEKVLSDLVADRFSILNTVKKASQLQDVSITLSMAFARGSSKYAELDELVANLMDLAQTRGGDQVAVQKIGEDVKFFGGSTEAQEKRSRVRVRVMAHTIRDVIQRCDNVIICCHKDADFDCIGAAIGMSRIVTAYNKQVSIIAKTGGIEEKLNAVLTSNAEHLKERVHFISESEALNQLKDNTLVLMVDHHKEAQSNGAQLLQKAKKVVIIDHHRRSAELLTNPMLVYIEAGASSTCELVTEFLPYVSNRTDIDELEANIMLAGITIDTNRFKMRTGVRTFEAASALRKIGADPYQVDEFTKDSYEEAEIKAQIMATIERYDHGVVLAPVVDRQINRTLISQVADNMLSIKDIEASFVIAKTNNDTTMISARSNGKINVQVILEGMNGGGHMTAAGLQRDNESVDDLKKELLIQINKYFEEGISDESNTSK